jgi:hypothetical protein
MLSPDSVSCRGLRPVGLVFFTKLSIHVGARESQHVLSHEQNVVPPKQSSQSPRAEGNMTCHPTSSSVTSRLFYYKLRGGQEASITQPVRSSTTSVSRLDAGP